jgi:hypothetical protein
MLPPAPVFLASVFEAGIQLIDLALVVCTQLAPLPHEGPNRRGQVAHSGNRLVARCDPGEAFVVDALPDWRGPLQRGWAR